MTNKSLEDAVIAALRKLGYDADTILPVHELHSDLGVDSTELIELAALVRTECGLGTQRIDLVGVKTVADLAGRIELLLRGGGSQCT